MGDIIPAIVSGSPYAVCAGIIIVLLRTILIKDKMFAEHMKDMLDATRAGAAADYAVAAALQRIEHKLELTPSNAGSRTPTPLPSPTGSST